MVVCALVATACSLPADLAESVREDEATETPAEGEVGGSEGDDPLDRSAERQGGPLRLTVQETAERIAELGGQLAIGNGPELKVTRPDGGAATVLDGADGASVAAQPVWSNEGTSLAWASSRPGVDGAGASVQVQPFDEQGQPTDERLESAAPGFPIFYLAWDAADEQLASLRNGPNGAGQVELGSIVPGSPLQPWAYGAPFFVAWAPEDARLAAHVNARAVWVADPPTTGPGAKPGAESLAAGDVLGAVTGTFSVLDWVDDQSLLVAHDGFLALLTLATGTNTESRLQPLVAVPDPIEFTISPDRTKVAYQGVSADAGAITVSTTSNPSPPISGRTDEIQIGPNERSLLVLNFETNEIEIVARDGAVAWEWSPDSERLAWLAPAGPGGGVRSLHQWNFWTKDDDGGTGTASTQAFTLSRAVESTYLPFFVQYSQSVTRWSPDSTAFAYAARFGSDGQVLVQLVNAVALPLPVSEGDVVTWGTGPTPPPPAGGVSPA